MAVDESAAASDDPAAFRAVARDVFRVWEAVECDGERPGFSTNVIADLSSCPLPEYEQEVGNVSTVTFIDNWRAQDLPGAAIALTFVWFSTSRGEIFDADITLKRNRNRQWTAGNIRGVLIHEVGHYFGLGHSAVAGATMTPGSGGDDVLHPDDEAGLCEIYPPGVLAETCDFQPRRGLELDCATAPATCAAHRPGASGGAVALLGIGLLVILVLTTRRARRRAR